MDNILTEGAQNWPFLMLIIFPVLAAATRRSVCHQRGNKWEKKLSEQMSTKLKSQSVIWILMLNVKKIILLVGIRMLESE